MIASTLTAGVALLIFASAEELPEPGTHGHYHVLTCTPHVPPPFKVVDLIYGPREIAGPARHVWWQLEARAEDKPEQVPLFQLRLLTSRDPLADMKEPLTIERYILRVPAAGDALEYRNVHTGRALPPAWAEFARHFIPDRARGSRSQEQVAETCRYLGHVLTLKYVGHNVAWDAWTDVQVLNLDPELLVGTGRSFKDREGHRLPQEPKRQNYTYIPFVEDDYRIMVDTGFNLFTVRPDQEKWVRCRPVFYLRGPAGEPPLKYPADLYRSNYLGCVMFMDEPTIIMVGDELIHKTLSYFTDAAATIEARTRARYNDSGSYGAFRLEKALRDAGVNFGDMRLKQWDYPSWETLYDTTFYQMAGGLAGLVHEGRYKLEPFDEAVARFTGTERKHTAEELLRYHFAFLRGGTRPFGKHWGTSIYGQCDPGIAPRAVTLAYEMGARYIWFWTSDHDHHVPWPEQIALVKTLRQHAAQHPRPSVFGPRPTLDRAIVIPYGYFLSLEHLWWVRVLDKEGKNDASQRYHRLMKRALAAVHDALDHNESFDITVDAGTKITGYRRVIRISDEP